MSAHGFLALLSARAAAASASSSGLVVPALRASPRPRRRIGSGSSRPGPRAPDAVAVLGTRPLLAPGLDEGLDPGAACTGCSRRSRFRTSASAKS